MSFVLALSCGAAMWPAHVRLGMDICRREEWMHGVSPTLSPPKFPWSHSSPGCRVGPSTASAALCGLLGVHSPLWPREDSRFIVLPQQASLPGSCFVLLDSVLSPEVRVQKVGGLGDSSTGCSPLSLAALGSVQSRVAGPAFPQGVAGHQREEAQAREGRAAAWTGWSPASSFGWSGCH